MHLLLQIDDKVMDIFSMYVNLTPGKKPLSIYYLLLLNTILIKMVFKKNKVPGSEKSWGSSGPPDDLDTRLSTNLWDEVHLSFHSNNKTQFQN